MQTLYTPIWKTHTTCTSYTNIFNLDKYTHACTCNIALNQKQRHHTRRHRPPPPPPPPPLPCEQLTLWLHHTQLIPLDTQVAQFCAVLHIDAVQPTENKTNVVRKTEAGNTHVAQAMV